MPSYCILLVLLICLVGLTRATRPRYIVELIFSTLTFATKQVEQGQLSEFVLIGTTLDSMEHGEICSRALGMLSVGWRLQGGTVSDFWR